MITRDEIIEIGIYNKPHGVNGEISATFQCDADVVKEFSCLITMINGIFVPFFVNSYRPKNSETLLLTLDGYDSEEAVKMFVNQPIYVKKSEFDHASELADCDEMPIDYFIGYTIVNDDGTTIGEIVDVDDSTDNVLFITELGDETSYIPAADDLIVDIDEDKQVITMSLPEGLLSI